MRQLDMPTRIRKHLSWVMVLVFIGLTLGCVQDREETGDQTNESLTVYYEIFVRSFYDSDGDGIGDLRGIIEKLDYLNDGDPQTDGDLEVGGIWLTPIHPSPSYHGYDVTDYMAIHPDFGTLDDFRELIEEAHQRGIKVIIDLVVNHTSNQHPWFVDAASATDSEYRDWYVWADETTNLMEGSATGGARAWHPMNGGHYLGVFWDGMPDLNFANPQVRQEMVRIANFWLELGVDGFRLDAAKHIFEDFASSRKNQQVIDQNIAWWQEFREGLIETKLGQSPYLVGEVWETSPALVAPYLDQAFDASFNFSAGELILQSLKSGKASSLLTFIRTQDLYAKTYDGLYVDAPFLTNHDQNRVMSELQGDDQLAKLAASMLLTLPGRPFIYYGEEIGMEGIKPDEQIREPMVWYAAQAGGQGQTYWQRRIHNQGGEISVEAQDDDENSLLSHYRTLIRLRNANPALHSGALLAYIAKDPAVMAYIREHDQQQLLILHNLSGQAKELTVKKNGEAFSRIIFSSKEGGQLQMAADHLAVSLPGYATVVLE